MPQLNHLSSTCKPTISAAGRMAAKLYSQKHNHALNEQDFFTGAMYKHSY